MSRAGEARAYRAPAVGRAFAVLSELSTEPSGLTLSELAGRTGLPASSLLTILGSLREAEAVRLSSRKRYSLGVGMLRLGQAYSDGNELVESFRGEGLRIARQFDETVHLGVLTGTDVVYIARFSSSRPPPSVTALGRRVAAHASAVGKAVLAWRPDVAALYPPDGGLQVFTSTTRRTVSELVGDLDEVRRLGYSESDAECIEALQCVSAAIFDHTGAVVGAIGISVPAPRMSAALRHGLRRSVVSSAAVLSRTLGAARLPDCYEAVTA